MKATILLLVIMSVISLPVWAMGGTEGHGGGGILCTDGSGKIFSATLLDLWEVDKDDKSPLFIPRSEEPKALQLERALTKLSQFDPTTAKAMRAVLADLEKPEKRVPIPNDKRLVPPTDTQLQYLKKEKNCSLVGIASFDDKNDILSVDQEFIDAMSQTDQAALDFHEAYYKVQRQSPAHVTSSIYTRRMTAAIFAGRPVLRIDPKTGLNKARFECDAGSGKYHFYILKDGSTNGTQVQFTKIAGRALIDRVVYDLSFQGQGTMPVRLRTFVEHLNDGFQKNSYEVEASGPSCQNYYGQLQDADSYFEPNYRVLLKTEDQIDMCDPTGGGCSIWFWQKPKLFKNVTVIIGLLDDFKQTHDVSTVKCWKK